MSMTDDALKEALDNAPVVFGLRAQGHIPTIQRMLSEGKTWDEIGEVINWEPATARRHYLRAICPAWHPQPTSTGVWIEAVAGKSRRLVTVLTLDQPWPSSSKWFGPIPEVPQ